ncbi:MAG: alcohol dehydrogenase catalytic domain-containing protein [Devosia sp.]|nr:alcohol dehydrogenase catalytic domain-containing protein [Devosia sp.]
MILKVGRCGICGTDLHRTEAGVATYREGAIPGHEFSGEVAATGVDVTTLKVGDLVTSLPYIGCNNCVHCLQGFPAFCRQTRNIGTDSQPGAFAEYVAVGAPFTLKLPQGLSLSDGALIEPLAVALRGVARAGIGPGTKVLVLGAGPIGLAAAYWAKHAGASRVAVQASSGRREAIARAMGADVFVQAIDGVSPAQAARAALGDPPDVVLECIGLDGSIDQAVASVRRQGMVVVLGACMAQDHWMPVRALTKEVDLRFSYVYDLRQFQIAIDTFERGAVEPRALVTDTVSLEGVSTAFDELRARSTQCKVLVNPWL